MGDFSDSGRGISPSPVFPTHGSFDISFRAAGCVNVIGPQTVERG